MFDAAGTGEARTHLIRGTLITHKLMVQWFLQNRLKSSIRKFYGRYEDLVCKYNGYLSLGRLLSDVFHNIG
jgi:hypothetical protein